MLFACGMTHSGGVYLFKIFATNTSTVYIPYLEHNAERVKVSMLRDFVNDLYFFFVNFATVLGNDLGLIALPG